MRTMLVCALLIVCTARAAAAPASERSIEDLLATTKAEALVESMHGHAEQMMRQGLRQAIQGRTLTPEQQRALDQVPARFVALMREELDWNKMKPLYIQLYRESFDQDELDGLLAFYKSAAGQAFINKMPLVMQKSMALLQGQMQSVLPKMKAAIDQALEDAQIPRPQ